MSYQDVKNSRKRAKDRILYVMGERCSICGYDKCNSALELHHIDPTQKDFTISRNTNRAWELVVSELPKTLLVCANCHREIHSDLIQDILYSSFDIVKAEEITQQLEELKSGKSLDSETGEIIYLCKDCGEKVSRNGVLCPSCAAKRRRRTIRPNREELKKLIRETSFVEIARYYNVSDNSIRKWCVKEQLPSSKREIKTYTDEEWSKL